MTTVEEIRTRLDVVKALARDLRPLSYPARLDLHKARRWQAALPRVPADDRAGACSGQDGGYRAPVVAVGRSRARG
jgi:hypothetical protein